MIMELAEIISGCVLPVVSFYVAANVGTYENTKEWIESHPNADVSWLNQKWDDLISSSNYHKARYYIGKIGIKLAIRKYLK